jgi:hypothetical protein
MIEETELEHDLRMDALWHSSNLDMLEQCIQYIREDMPLMYGALKHRFATEEYNRLEEQLRIMQRHKLGSVRIVHQEREQCLVMAHNKALQEKKG